MVNGHNVVKYPKQTILMVDKVHGDGKVVGRFTATVIKNGYNYYVLEDGRPVKKLRDGVWIYEII